MLKIVFDHNNERDAHAQKIIKRQLKKIEWDQPLIPGLNTAHQPRCCGCGNTFWVPQASDRWDCFDCAPGKESGRKGLGF